MGMAARKKVPSNIIGRWYEGKLVPVEREPNSRSAVRLLHYERHWTARVARVLVKFYLKNWQWLIGTIIAVVSLGIAVLALK
jgi:hypothetical protein